MKGTQVSFSPSVSSVVITIFPNLLPCFQRQMLSNRRETVGLLRCIDPEMTTTRTGSYLVPYGFF